MFLSTFKIYGQNGNFLTNFYKMAWHNEMSKYE